MASDEMPGPVGSATLVRLCAPMQDADLVAMIRRNGSLDTVDVAQRLGLGVKEARAWLRRLEAAGAIVSAPAHYTWAVSGPGWRGGQVLAWKAVDAIKGETP